MFEFLTKRKIHNEANILLFTAILAFVGMIVAAFLTYDHFYPQTPPLCKVGTVWDCGEVIHNSEYNQIFGIPLAILGLLGFVLILVFSSLRLLHWGEDYTKNFFLFVLLFALVGAVLSWYLTYLEIYVITKICPYCFTDFLFITIILVVDLYGFVRGSPE